MITVQRIVPDVYGDLVKDPRGIRYEDHLILNGVYYKLASVIEHLGIKDAGHYICAKKNWISLTPFMQGKDGFSSEEVKNYKYLNWSLISDTGKVILADQLDSGYISKEDLKQVKPYILIYQREGEESEIGNLLSGLT